MKYSSSTLRVRSIRHHLNGGTHWRMLVPPARVVVVKARINLGGRVAVGTGFMAYEHC
ncbi:hypothetical protein [Mycobacterium leprae]|nr:hypothetical protein [Mycobacterium leprae]